MRPHLPLVACFLLTQFASADEPTELVRLREQFVNAANRTVSPLGNKYVQQLELLKANYHKQGKTAERDLVANEIRNIKEALQAGLVRVEPGASVVNTPADGIGRDLKDLEGFWVNNRSSRSTETYEFKQRKMYLVYQYTSSDGSMNEQVSHYSVKQADDKIIITSDGSESSGYRQWYEINVPFSLENLEIVRLYTRPDGSSKSVLYLKRKQ